MFTSSQFCTLYQKVSTDVNSSNSSKSFPSRWVNICNVSDEAAWLLVLQELADAGPSFVLKVTEVGGGALIDLVHVLLLQLHRFGIHPDSFCDHVDYFWFW